MPKDLIDVDAFTSPVTVPVDTDSRNAASVELPFQALADRTRFNRNTGHLANFDVATFGPGMPFAASGIVGYYMPASEKFGFVGGVADPRGGISETGGGPGAPSTGGTLYEVESAGGLTGATIEIAADHNDVRVRLENLTADGVYRSAVVGDDTWPIQAIPAAPGLAFQSVAHDRNVDGGGGMWVIVDNTGQVYSSPDGSTWTLRVAAGLVGTSARVTHSHDALNSHFVIMTNTQRATSADGITWSVALHGLTTHSNRLDYSPDAATPGSGTWLGIVFTGTKIVRSEDGGATWTEVVDIPDGTGIGRAIASDDRGNWLVCTTDERNLFSSVDNGATWRKEYPQQGQGISKSIGAQLSFGAGRFVIFSDTDFVWFSERVGA